MIKLKLAKHTCKANTDIIEIWKDGAFIGAVYPTDEGVKVISKYELKHFINKDLGMWIDILTGKTQ